MVKISTTSKTYTMNGTARNLVRTSAGVLYAVLHNTSDNAIEMWKSSDNGASWTIQDSGNEPVANPAGPNYYYAPSICLDSSDNILVAYHKRNTGSFPIGFDIKLRTFTTSSDTWGSSTTLFGTATIGDPTYPATSICVDVSGYIHIAHSGTTTARGTTTQAIFYTTNSTGSWTTATTGAGVFPDIMFSRSISKPIITGVLTTVGTDNLRITQMNTFSSGTIVSPLSSSDSLSNTNYSGPQTVETADGTLVCFFVDSGKQQGCEVHLLNGGNFSTGWSSINYISPSSTVDFVSGSSRSYGKVHGDTNMIYAPKDGATNIALKRYFDYLTYKNFTWNVETLVPTGKPLSILKLKWSNLYDYGGQTRADYLYLVQETGYLSVNHSFFHLNNSI